MSNEQIYNLGNASITAILNAIGAGLIKTSYRPKPSKNYIPAGSKCNVRGTYCKNPKQAEQMNEMWRNKND